MKWWCGFRQWHQKCQKRPAARWPLNQMRRLNQASRPADLCWAPSRLAPRRALRRGFMIVVPWLRCLGEKVPVAQQIDIDRAPKAITIAQHHSNVCPAIGAQHLTRRFQAKRIQLQVLRLPDRYLDPRLRVGERAHIMLATERALACAQNLLMRISPRVQHYTDRTAMAGALVVDVMIHDALPPPTLNHKKSPRQFPSASSATDEPVIRPRPTYL